MKKSILSKKIGMTKIYDEQGMEVPASAIEEKVTITVDTSASFEEFLRSKLEKAIDALISVLLRLEKDHKENFHVLLGTSDSRKTTVNTVRFFYEDIEPLCLDFGAGTSLSHWKFLKHQYDAYFLKAELEKEYQAFMDSMAHVRSVASANCAFREIEKSSEPVQSSFEKMYIQENATDNLSAKVEKNNRKYPSHGRSMPIVRRFVFNSINTIEKYRQIVRETAYRLLLRLITPEEQWFRTEIVPLGVL